MATTPRSDAQTVVVTGLGATSPVGGDVASTWDAMLAGRSGVRTLTEELGLVDYWRKRGIGADAFLFER